jgi:hypothetical protein
MFRLLLWLARRWSSLPVFWRHPHRRADLPVHTRSESAIRARCYRLRIWRRYFRQRRFFMRSLFWRF